MIETTQAILKHRGQSNLPLLLEASRGRCIAAHFGTYDYTASYGITAAHQHMLHPACDFARSMMQVAFAGTSVWLSDGGTNILPVPVHREGNLNPAQHAENREVIHRAWKLHFDHVQHSLENGFFRAGTCIQRNCRRDTRLRLCLLSGKPRQCGGPVAQLRADGCPGYDRRQRL